MPYAAVAAAPVAPQLPSVPLKPSAKGSDPFELAVSSVTPPRRMSTEMSELLNDTPIGTTTTAHVTTTCVPGQRTNKTPIFISDFSDTRSFLVWLRASCLYPLTAQPNAAKLMVVPSTADCLSHSKHSAVP
jgi:hypothetical protein